MSKATIDEKALLSVQGNASQFTSVWIRRIIEAYEQAKASAPADERDKILSLFWEAQAAFDHGDDVTHMLRFGEASERLKRWAAQATEAKATDPSTSDEGDTEQPVQKCDRCHGLRAVNLRFDDKGKRQYDDCPKCKTLEDGADWEYFCDHCYYDQWAVRKRGERSWGHCFHVPTLEEAKGLAAILNRRAQDRESTAQPPAQQPAGVDDLKLIELMCLAAWGTESKTKRMIQISIMEDALDAIRPYLRPQPAQQEADDDDVEVTIAEAIALLPHKMPVEDKGIAVAKALCAAGLKVVREVKP